MGNLCCSEQKIRLQNSRIVSVRQKSLTDPQTKKEYEKSLEYILNQALEKFQGKYKIKQLKLQGLIGKGGQASVFQVDVLCQQNGQQIVKKLAMKRVSKKHINQDLVKQALLLEKQILIARPSCFITEIEFACQDDAYLYFFMKLAIGGDCYSFIKHEITLQLGSNQGPNDEFQKAKQFNKLGQKAIIFILAAVVLGLESLHDFNIIYRDLKPQNILFFEDGYPRLADFGVAMKFQDQEDLYYEIKGTILYFAPQMANKLIGYDRSVDLWALGVLAFQLVFKEPPFSANHIKSKIFQRKVEERLEKNVWPSNAASNDMKDFINKLLLINPCERLGYVSFKELKQHKLFESIKWEEFENRKMKSPLINIIRKYPVQIKTETAINQTLDQQNHGYIPFTFVRNTADTDRKTLQIIPFTFVIDQKMNLKPAKYAQVIGSATSLRKIKNYE